MCTANLRSLWLISVLSLMLSFTGPARAIPDPSAIYCTELGYSFEIRTDGHGGTYGVCVFPDESFCSSWAYFTECYLGEPSGECHWPCQELPCKQAGQTVYIGQCCEGLKQIQAAEAYDQDCNAVGIGGPGPICSDCGNGICEPWESKCNCPLDCREPRIIYVDDDAVGANDGSSWADAYSHLQDALTDANSSEKPVEIRVAQGVYTPDSNSAVPDGTGDRQATFQLINGVALKGSYAGLAEPDPNAHDVELYETILSGDLNGNDAEATDTEELLYEESRQENSYHVFTASGTDRIALLDGCTITGGQAWSEQSHGVDEFCYGGGLYAIAGSATVRDCKFVWNTALNYGGGVHIDHNSAPLFVNCIFSHNSSTDGGGLNSDRSSPTINECAFIANAACSYNADGGFGAGMYSYQSNARLTRCIFSRNSSDEWGGAGGFRNREGTATLANCIFSGNSAGREPGGAVYNDWSDIVLVNCTFHSNSTLDKGGAVYTEGSGSSIVRNCIVWADDPDEIQGDNVNVIVSYSNVQGGYPGAGNTDRYPLFADPNDGDYRLKSQGGRWDANEGRWTKDDVTSPCIDAGNLMSPIGTEPFPNGGIINMGAYGGTTEASKSYFDKPPCQTIIAGDINGDCLVDFQDFRLMALHWLEDNSH